MSMMLSVRVPRGAQSPRQFIERLRKRVAGPHHESAAGDTELAGQRRQSRDGAQPGAAVPVALQSVAPGDRRR